MTTSHDIQHNTEVGGTSILMEPSSNSSPPEAEHGTKDSALKKQDYLLGIGLLLLVVFLWTSANFITQDLFEEGFNKPFLVTYLNTSAFAVYLLPFLYRRYVSPRGYQNQPSATGYQALATDASQGETGVATVSRDSNPTSQSPLAVLHPIPLNTDSLPPLNTQETIQLAAAFCILWFIANWTLNVALEYTSVASATILSSMSGFFTLGIGRLFRIEKLTIAKITAVLMSFIGVTLVSLSDSSDTKSSDLIRRVLSAASPLPPRPVLGDTLALLSAALYALYVTLLKVRIKSESRIDMQLFFGFVGLFNIVGCWPIAVLLHLTAFEPFELPHGSKVIIAILLNMFITWSSDYIYVLAMLKTTPLVVTVGLSLTIPLAVVGDFFLKRSTHGQVIVGALLVIIGFIVVGVDGPEHSNEEPPPIEVVPRRSRSLAPEEVELLPDGQRG